MLLLRTYLQRKGIFKHDMINVSIEQKTFQRHIVQYRETTIHLKINDLPVDYR